MLVSVQGTVFAADRNSPDDLSDQTVQSVIRADVPDSHKITVKGEHVTVSLEGGNQEENQEENSILVERFSEPKLKFSPEKGWKIKKVSARRYGCHKSGKRWNNHFGICV